AGQVVVSPNQSRTIFAWGLKSANPSTRRRNVSAKGVHQPPCSSKGRRSSKGHTTSPSSACGPHSMRTVVPHKPLVYRPAGGSVIFTFRQLGRPVVDDGLLRDRVRPDGDRMPPAVGRDDEFAIHGVENIGHGQQRHERVALGPTARRYVSLPAAGPDGELQ